MALGLLVVHLHSRFLSGVTGLSFGFSSSSDSAEAGGGDTVKEIEVEGDGDLEKVPLPDYLLWKAFHLTADQVKCIVNCTCTCTLYIQYMYMHVHVCMMCMYCL